MIEFIKKNETICALLFPIIGTYSTYIVELGRLKYYGIPFELISIGINEIILSSAAILFFLILLLMSLSIIKIITDINHPATKLLKVPLTGFIIIFFILLLVPMMRKFIIEISLIWIMFFTFSTLVTPLFKKENNKTYREKLEKELTREKKNNITKKGNTGIGNARKYFSFLIIPSIFLFWIGYNIPYFKDTYQVIEEYKGLLVIKISTDQIILKRLIEGTNTLGDEIKIIHRPSVESLTIRELKTGTINPN